MTKRAFVLFLAAVALAGCATTGKQIGSYANPRRALLVMDVQKDFTTEAARMPVDLDTVPLMIKNINMTISRFQQNGDLVIYVRNVFHKNDLANIYRHSAAVEGSPGIAFDDRLKMVSGRVFDKSQPNAFSNPDFESYLIDNQVFEVTVVGVFADQCVYETSRGALDRGYKVKYAVDAVAAKTPKDVSNAAQSIEKHGATLVRIGD